MNNKRGFHARSCNSAHSFVKQKNYVCERLADLPLALIYSELSPRPAPTRRYTNVIVALGIRTQSPYLNLSLSRVVSIPPMLEA